MKSLLFSLSILLLNAFTSFFGSELRAQQSSDSLFFAEFLKEVSEEESFRNSFHGFSLYDLDSNRYICNYNADKFFTPASNVKLFTFFAGLKMLSKEIVNLAYAEKGEDSLIIWGTGDPTFLHLKLQNSAVLDFLKKQEKKKIFLSVSNFDDRHFGNGWAWDDYTSEYSVEKSAFPIYGNMVVFEADPSCSIKSYPDIFSGFTEETENLKTRSFRIVRDLSDNAFRYNLGSFRGKRYRNVPFRTQPEFIAQLLTDTLKQEVGLTDYPRPAHARKLQSFDIFEMYKVMMQQSDNFLAEQTLLMCSEELFATMETQKAIDFVIKHFLNDLTNQPRWVDGSGLSRYNLFTPRSFTEVLRKIHELVPHDKLKETLAVGGQSGTLKSRYKASEPFLWGKTGTLSNNHCLSGYLRTKSGRLLCFSFMNNHHRVRTRNIAEKMEAFLTKIHMER